MWIRVAALLLTSVSLPALVLADEAPAVEHQPVLCTVAEKPLSLCASISDDGNVSAARVYFRRSGESYYSFVDMAFTGVNYCGVLPAPKANTKALEYYMQALDEALQPTRTSTYRILVQAEGVCEFPPLAADAAKAAGIKVFATNKKQGRKLDGGFVSTGVTFVPVAR